MTHSNRPWVRAVVSAFVASALLTVWVYQLFHPDMSPDTALTAFVFVLAFAAVTHFYGRKAVGNALSIVRGSDGRHDHDHDDDDGSP